jgi:hypothetical protein
MSENIEAPAAPQTTQDIAASVIQEAETQDSAPVESAAPETTQTETKTTDAQMSAAEELLREAGYTPKRIDGRDNLIPWSRVAKIIEKGITEGRGDFGQKYQKLTTDHESVSKEAAELRAFRDDFAAALRGDETAFLSEIAKHDPRYARFLQQQVAAAQAQPASPPALAMPAPDVPLPNGGATYSVEGLQNLIQWAVDAKMMPKVDERLKPYADRDKADQERAAADQAQAAVTERARSQAAEARTWPNFTEYEPDILKKLAADTEQARAAGKRPTMTAREAYLEVHAERLAADDTTKRARWAEEVNKAPKSTAVGRTGAEVTRPAGPRTSREIVQATIAQLESQSS